MNWTKFLAALVVAAVAFGLLWFLGWILPTWTLYLILALVAGFAVYQLVAVWEIKRAQGKLQELAGKVR